jgi:hypothetical protein
MPITGPLAGFDPIQLNSFLQAYGENVQYDDFLYGDTLLSSFQKQWLPHQAGGDVFFLAANNNVVGHPGIVELDTQAGPPATNAVTMDSAPPIFFFANGYWSVSWMANLPVLSSAGEAFSFAAGIGDVAPGYLNSVFIRQDTTAGGNWTIGTIKAGVSTLVDSGVLPVAGLWTLLTITGADSTSATFSINGVNVGSILTNIPSAAGIKPFVTINKTIGNANRIALLDFCYFGCAYSAFR